jgi:hypothetical protein
MNLQSYDNRFLAYPFNNNSLNIYHQNIMGLQGKTNELVSSFYPELPHLLCLTEQHLVNSELDHTRIEHYSLGAEYCRQTFRQGGVCICVHEKLKFSNVNLNEFCKEQDLEVCVVKLQFPCGNICILAIYISQPGNFLYFLNVLRSLYSTNL